MTLGRYAGVRRQMQWATGLLLALLLGMPAIAAPVAKPAAPTHPTVLVFGDSLSAAYGIPASQGWVALLEKRLHARQPRWDVVNASISGETTAGGVARIDAALARVKPAIVVLELGGNDGLRGLPLAQTREHLAMMVAASRKSGAKVLLLGMRMPPNMGRAYTEGFHDNYVALAKVDGVALLPFLLQPLVDDRSNFQADNLHPTAAAQRKLLNHVWKALEPLL